MRPTDLFPQPIIDELLRVARTDRRWVRWRHLGITDPTRGNFPMYECRAVVPTWAVLANRSGQDNFAMWASSIWLVDGPKVFRPSTDQCRAMEQVEVNMALEDYSQPYPAIMVELPRGLYGYGPFTGVIALLDDGPSGRMCILQLFSVGHENDIVSTIATNGRPMEVSIQRFDDDCAYVAKLAGRVCRVALNSCLALSAYGSHLSYLFPKEVERDQRIAQEDSERGERARRRLPLAVMVASLDREVVLYRTERPSANRVSLSGREMSCHWRRGHWHTVACGVGKTERKRVLYPPILVRTDLLVGSTSDTRVTYRTAQ